MWLALETAMWVLACGAGALGLFEAGVVRSFVYVLGKTRQLERLPEQKALAIVPAKRLHRRHLTRREAAASPALLLIAQYTSHAREALEWQRAKYKTELKQRLDEVIDKAEARMKTLLHVYLLFQLASGAGALLWRVYHMIGALPRVEPSYCIGIAAPSLWDLGIRYATCQAAKALHDAFIYAVVAVALVLYLALSRVAHLLGYTVLAGTLAWGLWRYLDTLDLAGIGVPVVLYVLSLLHAWAFAALEQRRISACITAATLPEQLARLDIDRTLFFETQVFHAAVLVFVAVAQWTLAMRDPEAALVSVLV